MRHDIRFLLNDELSENEETNTEVLRLWDDKEGSVRAGVSYKIDADDQDEKNNWDE